MSLRNLSCGFCALIALAVGNPALAQTNNGGVVVNINSNTTINGSNNTATNSNTQNVRDSSTNRGPGITVRSIQTCDITGNSNNCINRSNQTVDRTRR
jgi:nitrate reductase cytochrome c-type subunit